MSSLQVLVVVGLILALHHPLCAIASTSTQLEVQALSVMMENLVDPNGALTNWESLLVSASTFWHLESNNDNSVTKMNLGRQDLSGQLVGNIELLTSLEHMLLNDNKISGSIPSEFGNLKSLLDLDLHNNILNGSIPDSLGKLSKLLYIRLQGNKLSGVIPKSFTDLKNLLVLDLSNNKLTGEIPAGLFDQLPKLRYLNLSNNGLSGDLPASLTADPGFIVDLTNNNMLKGNCVQKACEFPQHK